MDQYNTSPSEMRRENHDAPVDNLEDLAHMLEQLSTLKKKIAVTELGQNVSTLSSKIECMWLCRGEFFTTVYSSHVPSFKFRKVRKLIKTLQGHLQEAHEMLKDINTNVQGKQISENVDGFNSTLETAFSTLPARVESTDPRQERLKGIKSLFDQQREAREKLQKNVIKRVNHEFLRLEKTIAAELQYFSELEGKNIPSLFFRLKSRDMKSKCKENMTRMQTSLQVCKQEISTSHYIKQVSDIHVSLDEAIESAVAFEHRRDSFVEQVKATYGILYDSVQPLPYIKQRLLNVNKVFVEGGIQYWKESWRNLQTYNDILKNDELQSSRRIVLGDPGFGKTTLSLQMVYDWCKVLSSSRLKDTEMVIFLRLRQLRDTPSIHNAILKFILGKGSCLSENDVKEVLLSFTSVVIILDGWDEFEEEDIIATQNHDIRKVISGEMFSTYDVILTSRFLPHNYCDNFKRVKLIGFTEEARVRYIQEVVTKNDQSATRKILLDLKESPLQDEFCHVPIFFVMFAHMKYEDANLKQFFTVTSFFKHVLFCLQEHMQNKFEDEGVQRKYLYMGPNDDLNKLAFNGLCEAKYQWQQEALLKILSTDVFQQYKAMGIICGGDNIDDLREDPTHVQLNERKFKFYHRIFQEWYAAKYLVQYLMTGKGIVDDTSLQEVIENIKSKNCPYLFRFACGMSSKDVTLKICCYLRKKKKAFSLAKLCILENRNKELIQKMCSATITFTGEKSQNQHKTNVLLLKIATDLEVPVTKVVLSNSFGSFLHDSECITLRSGINLPVCPTLSKLEIAERQNMMEREHVDAVLSYAARCDSLTAVSFRSCLMPLTIESNYLGDLLKKGVQVLWYPRLFGWFRLDVSKGKWMVRKRQITEEEYKLCEQCCEVPKKHFSTFR